jgi:hypothetical protein
MQSPSPMGGSCQGRRQRPSSGCLVSGQPHPENTKETEQVQTLGRVNLTLQVLFGYGQRSTLQVGKSGRQGTSTTVMESVHHDKADVLACRVHRCQLQETQREFRFTTVQQCVSCCIQQCCNITNDRIDKTAAVITTASHHKPPHAHHSLETYLRRWQGNRRARSQLCDIQTTQG